MSFGGRHNNGTWAFDYHRRYVLRRYLPQVARVLLFSPLSHEQLATWRFRVAPNSRLQHASASETGITKILYLLRQQNTHPQKILWDSYLMVMMIGPTQYFTTSAIIIPPPSTNFSTSVGRRRLLNRKWPAELPFSFCTLRAHHAQVSWLRMC